MAGRRIGEGLASIGIRAAAVPRRDWRRQHRRGTPCADRPDCEIVIGQRTYIGRSTIVCAKSVTIGDDVLISWGCEIIDHDSHALLWKDRART